MLQSQRIFGNRDPNINLCGNAAFGVVPFDTLPEDQHDRQPLLKHGRLLIADVRIDNRDELVRDLGKVPKANTASDSELLLSAWLKWGEACLDRIVGEYAFAIYDTEARKLSLVRDPLGQRPLFFAQHGDEIAFASMVSGILALPRFRHGFNHRTLALAVADVPREDNSTYFNGIYRVMPGQVVTLTPRGASSRTYWQPNLDPLNFGSSADYVDAYRSVLDDAVRSRLRRLNRPIATHLSSGLDSNAVAATAARIGNPCDPIFAFTSAPRSGFCEPFRRGRFADESAAAALTAQKYGMQHEVVRSSGSSLSLIRSQVATNQEPNCNILNLHWLWSIERLAHDKGAGILLTGEYGNATLNAGGLRTMPEWVRTMRWARWWHEARFCARRDDVRWRGILFNSFEPWLPHPVRQALYRAFHDVDSRSESVFLAKPWILSIGDQLEMGFLGNVAGNFAESRLGMLRRQDHAVLWKGALARHGIDYRSPLIDRRVVEFSLRLPPEQMLSEGISQPLARQALSDRVPKKVLTAKGRGYQSADWFETLDPGEIRTIVEEIATSSMACDLIDVQKVHQTVDHWPAADENRFGQYQRLSTDLPNALAVGLFMLEAERWMSAPAPTTRQIGRSDAAGPMAVPA